jgi:hypothetical protein
MACPMRAQTWETVHVGDTVLGADQRAWQVVGREPRAPWLVAGEHAKFTLQLGDRVVTTDRRLLDDAPLTRRADHQADAAAWQALHDAGFRPILIGEKVDAFASPETGVKRDRYGRYLLPHPSTGIDTAWTRVTTLARTLADEYGLNQWAKRNVAKGMSLRPDLIAGAAAADPEEDKSTLEHIVKQAEDAAGAKKGANFGTAFHQAAQRVDRGESLKAMTLPAPIDADVAAYVAKLRECGLRIIPDYMERIVIIPELEVAGTLDRITHQMPGVTKSAPLSVLDLKSGKDLSYSWLEIAIQQALYAHASHMWDKPNQRWIPMPAVDQHRALIAHSPIGKGRTDIYGVDLIKGWAFAQLAAQVRLARKQKLGWLVQPQDPTTVGIHLISTSASVSELAELWERFFPQGLWTEELHAAAMAQRVRIQAAEVGTA